jgi:DNA-binding response OmpR family regulator
MAQTVLIVDDERKLREMLRLYLEQDGYRVVEAGNGREALYVARYERPDLIILDLMMPEMTGSEFMRVYRREAKTPVIMLTARVEESDEILGLELGADDYITKPFSVRALLARVRAVLRRALGEPDDSGVLRVGEVMLDRGGHLVRVRNEPVELTPSEFAILAALMAVPGRALSRLDLLDHVSGDAFEGYERTIDVHIRNLRTKIEVNPGKPLYIQTVYGMGYRFSADTALPVRRDQASGE